jgi:hypothetical protein
MTAYSSLTVKQLQGKCRARHLKVTGTRVQLIRRLQRKKTTTKRSAAKKVIRHKKRQTVLSVRKIAAVKRSKSKRYHNKKTRKGPSVSALLVPIGAVRKGNDGCRWKVIKSGKTQRWSRLAAKC